jgi:dTDP-4-amino-4,6-dideoxygalactose transaminase
MTKQKVPFLDLVTPHQQLKMEFFDVLETALNTASFIGGEALTHFERDFAAFCDVKFSIGVSSGTDALRFALMACGIGAGESAITVPNTFIATGEAISQSGALIEFVDVDERTYNLDPVKLRAYLETQCEFDSQSGRLRSKRTGRKIAAVVPVHLYGQMADMDAILELAEQYHLIVVEDACQAHGAEYFSQKEQRWRKAGSIGRAAAFSFYPGKNLGACGEAGAATTNDPQVARRMQQLRDHGQAQKYYHDVEGYNGRLDSIQAGFLGAKLPYLAQWNEQRRAHAQRYNQLLSAMAKSVSTPFEPTYSKAVYHLYVLRTPNRDRLRDCLNEKGIGTGIHYPVPLHLQKAYESLGYRKGDFPIAEAVSEEIVSLPMFPQLTLEQQEMVVAELLSFIRAEETAGCVLA